VLRVSNLQDLRTARILLLVGSTALLRIDPGADLLPFIIPNSPTNSPVAQPVTWTLGLAAAYR